jgi:hypothetical protein
MATGVSVRQRYPDPTKELKVIRTYEEYARFEAAFVDILRLENSSSDIVRRSEELKYESAKTLDALKTKPPVRIPETKSAETEGKGETAPEKGTLRLLLASLCAEGRGVPPTQ